MTDLRLSRRDVTRALATLPILAVPALASAAGGAGKLGDNAMNMHSTNFATTSAVARPPFDARAWFGRFRKSGGWWGCINDAPSTGWAPDLREKPEAMIEALSETERDAVRALIRANAYPWSAA